MGDCPPCLFHSQRQYKQYLYSQVEISKHLNGNPHISWEVTTKSTWMLSNNTCEIPWERQGNTPVSLGVRGRGMRATSWQRVIWCVTPQAFPASVPGCQGSEHPTKPSQTMGAVSKTQTCSTTANLCQSPLVPGGQQPNAGSSQQLWSTWQVICDQENPPLVPNFHPCLIPVAEEDIGKAYALPDRGE